jgi:hypothetical protein
MTKLDELKETIAALVGDELNESQRLAIDNILGSHATVYGAHIKVPAGWYLYAENPEIKAIFPDHPHMVITACNIEPQPSTSLPVEPIQRCLSELGEQPK